ncbi:hypothetical protein [Methanocella arvoryzae]|nr:hypothetical protein [Methanocella arvoryzae]
MITRYCHTIDGQPTSADFISKWKATHNGQWYPEAKMYVHWFRDVTPS